MGAWSVYLLCCADGTLYAGVTTDLPRRLREHNAGGARGARYTRSRRPVQLIHAETAANRAEACRREAAIKKLSREAKLALAARVANQTDERSGEMPALPGAPSVAQASPPAPTSDCLLPTSDAGETPALQSPHGHP